MPMDAPGLHDAGVVLLVDDVPDNLRLLCDVLDDAGYTLLIAMDGERALETARRVQPDVILLDALMPGMDGFATCRRLKADAATRDVPVIFMTGLTETEHVLEGFAAGGVDYVTKPIQPEVVLARVAAHVQSARRVLRARDAIETAGGAVVVVNATGEPLWLTPQASRWLQDFVPGNGRDGLVDALRTWVEERIGLRPPGSRETFVAEQSSKALRIRYGGRVAEGEHVFVLESGPSTGSSAPMDSFRLTPRELEVLGWVSKGKTNRDIGEILGMSPRTVNKHLEHIYEKLGVETRTAAAAMAMRIGGGEG